MVLQGDNVRHGAGVFVGRTQDVPDRDGRLQTHLARSDGGDDRVGWVEGLLLQKHLDGVQVEESGRVEGSRCVAFNPLEGYAGWSRGGSTGMEAPRL